VSFERKSKLPRLPPDWYRGGAAVIWTHTIEQRAKGWLDAAFHARFREVLVHAGARYSLVCPAYVLMPDHWHVVWLGVAGASDQRTATRFLRQHLQPHLGAARLQDRAHDHVLREGERERGAFVSAVSYVRENPVRAGLCATWVDWEFAGAAIAGYPDLDPRADDFWDVFWRIHAKLAGEA
jgi:putative transposase